MMRVLRIAVVALFFALLLIPVVLFDGQSTVSEIDNRTLETNPLAPGAEIDNEKGISGMLEDFVADRIGLRTEMIRLYTLGSDAIFREMVHPSYTYGKDGYVFFRNGGDGPVCTDYDRAFAEMVVKIQTYCGERNVPFLFVFNPIKNAVLQDKLPAGVNYNNGWKTEFFRILEEAGVRYVDTTQMLVEKTRAGEAVFNRQYNAGHWNDLGAFYGVNEMLGALEEDFPALSANRREEFTVEQKLNTSLQVSEFPIHEVEPIYTSEAVVRNITDSFAGEVRLNEQYRHFRYVVNEAQVEKGAPRALVFQGSYMNGMGYKFLDNRLGEYISVHNYQNIIDFDYYFHLFQPECVIFEVAEYTFADRYFSYSDMRAMDLAPALSAFSALPEISGGAVHCTMEKGDALCTLCVPDLPTDTAYAYALIGNIEYDLHRAADGAYTLTLAEAPKGAITVVAIDEMAWQRQVFRTE